MPDSPSVRSQSPGSPTHADGQGDNGTTKAAKDRPCPFCGQPFTSSSLGRHLDLYIKSINPKPPDGVHNVAKIREMRGKITRRQPRGSLRKSELAQDDVDPMIDSDSRHEGSVIGENKRHRVAEHDSPAASKTPQRQGATQLPSHRTGIGGSNWQGTGVIPGLPVHSANMDRFNRTNYLSADPSRSFITSPAASAASPRPMVTAAIASEVEELGRAAQLALHEVLDSLTAARAAYSPLTLFDFDYSGETFPGLCLRLLPSPRTIFSSTPFASPETWPISQPGDEQKVALAKVIKARAKTLNLETAPETQHCLRHLDDAYKSWTSLSSDAERERTWHLEVLRTYSRSQRLLGERTAELRLAKQQAEYFRRQYELATPRMSAGTTGRSAGGPMPITPEELERFEDEAGERRGWTFDGLIDKWRGKMRDEQKSAAAEVVEAVENVVRVVDDTTEGRPASSVRPESRKRDAFRPSGLFMAHNNVEGGDQSWLDGAGKAVERVLQRHGNGTSSTADIAGRSSAASRASTAEATDGLDDDQELRETQVNENGKRARPVA